MRRIDEISSVLEALCLVQELTKTTVSEEEFFEIVVAHALPVYAKAPIDAKLETRVRGEQGMLVTSPAPQIKASFITLLQPEIQQIGWGGSALTDRPAWLPGEELCVPWDDVLAFRQANHRVVAEGDVDKGEWMGQSETYYFANFVRVTRKSNLCVPRHTVAEVVRIINARSEFVGDVAGLKEQEQELFEDSDLNVPARFHQNHSGPQGINKQQVLIAFEALLPMINLKKQLSDAKHIFGDAGARVQRGTKGDKHKSLWNPVLLAIGINERYSIPRLKLTRMFSDHAFLSPWREEWLEQVENLGL
jgi:hypothetical protein